MHLIANIFLKSIILFFCLLIASCNKDGADTTELWKKANTSGEIINRSGTVFNPAVNKELAMSDAQNRLRSGGGLFGKKGGFDFDRKNNDTNGLVASIGMPINPYLWEGALETISFMPLSSADPFSGIIITDWYSLNQGLNERCKLNIFIKGVELKTQNLKVGSFCQQKINQDWKDMPTNNKTNTSLENAILNKAKKIKLNRG